MELLVKKLVDGAQLPIRSSEGAVGYDLHSVNGYVILPGRRAIVSTGISVQLPPGVYGRVAPRSGLAVKNGIDVGAGVIDPDYTGELSSNQAIGLPNLSWSGARYHPFWRFWTWERPVGGKVGLVRQEIKFVTSIHVPHKTAWNPALSVHQTTQEFDSNSYIYRRRTSQ